MINQNRIITNREMKVEKMDGLRKGKTKGSSEEKEWGMVSIDDVSAITQINHVEVDRRRDMPISRFGSRIMTGIRKATGVDGVIRIGASENRIIENPHSMRITR